jgi:hypothetical protein
MDRHDNVIELFDPRTTAALALRELAAKLALPDYPVRARQRALEAPDADRLEIPATALPGKVVPLRRKPPAA